jgi:hypothetical protein
VVGHIKDVGTGTSPKNKPDLYSPIASGSPICLHTPEVQNRVAESVWKKEKAIATFWTSYKEVNETSFIGSPAAVMELQAVEAA